MSEVVNVDKKVNDVAYENLYISIFSPLLAVKKLFGMIKDGWELDESTPASKKGSNIYIRLVKVTPIKEVDEQPVVNTDPVVETHQVKPKPRTTRLTKAKVES